MTGQEFLDFLAKLDRDLAEVGRLAPTATLAALSQALTDLRADFPKDNQGQPNAGGFDQLPAEQRDRLAARLSRLSQALEGFTDGSTNPSDIMYRHLASNGAVWALGSLAAIITLVLLFQICTRWKDANRATVPCDAQNLSANQSKPPNANPVLKSVSSEQSPAGGTPTTSKGGNLSQPSARQPEVVPSQATLTTCQSITLKVDIKDAGTEASWPDVPTGSLSSDGVFTAPSSIASQQTLRIAPAVKVSGLQQTAKAAIITLMPPGGPPEESVLLMIAPMGALGGCLHWISGLVIYVGNRQFLRSWIAYYLLMPIEGAALAVIIYLLLRAGILTPAATGGQVTATLNTTGLYAFAGLTGIYSKQALQALGEVFNVLFKKVQAKDQVKDDKAKG